MNKKSLFLRTIIFAIVLLIGIVIAITINIEDKTRDEKNLKVYNPAMLNPELVDSSLHNIGIGHRIKSFKLINQLGDTVTEKIVDNKIHVVDFFFTTCSNICPKMTTQLERVQEKFKEQNDFMILSHTVTPHIDTVEQLKTYADSHGADAKNWMFLTGDKKHIYDLARKFYFTLKPKEVGEDSDDIQSDFIHTNNFVLVDRQKRIRGFYDGTSSDEVSQLMSDIEFLFEE